MRRWSIVLYLIALALPATAGERTFNLQAGEAVFWTGPYVDTAQNGRSWSYRLEVAEPARRLRIGFDHPEVDDDYSIRIEDPSGQTSVAPSGDGLYSWERIFERPKPGSWRITINATDVDESNFRVRAKLESREPSLGVDEGPVLPNLQVLPPHEASFLMPITNGASPGEIVGLDLLGAESCHPEEHAEDGALRCLRFAFGIRNTGRGPLQLYHEGASYQDRKLFQRIQFAQGGSVDRAAGTARYHKTHAHYHHHDAVGLELFKVVDPKSGELESAGPKHFKGFAHRNELLREWDVFYPTWSAFGFGLQAGWADIYEWDRPGNYIDFGLNGDGLYVVRMMADPVRGVAESNEADNRGYTYLKVTGSEVELLEAGRGRDPWDACKIEVGFGGHPDPPAHKRPASCPDDTV